LEEQPLELSTVKHVPFLDVRDDEMADLQILRPAIASEALIERIVNELHLPLFGNRELLHWETDREKQREWLQRAGLTLPQTFKNPNDIKGLVIAKLPGARGGKGYFLANSPESFHEKAGDMIKRGHLRREELENIHLQEYILGVNVYPSYFHSEKNTIYKRFSKLTILK